MARVAEARILDRGTSSLRVYERLSLPMIDDRDFTLEVRWAAEQSSWFVTYHAVDAGVAAQEGVVRVEQHDGGWQLHPTADGGTRVRFESNLDLGGSVPSWMTRSGAADELPGVFDGLCRLVEPELHGKPCPTPR
jgi:START domain-containing protein